MMHPIIKQAADSGNLRSLKNIFANALDVDPTFENYQEEFDYIRSKGLLEPHRDLTPFIEDPARWTESYWLQLEVDLVENFSEKRMEHMKRVAQVFLKEKIERLRVERSAERQQITERNQKPDEGNPAQNWIPAQEHQTPKQLVPGSSRSSFVISETTAAMEKQRREIEAEKRRIAVQNKAIAEREEEQRRKLERRSQELQQSAQGGSPSSKKAPGIAAIAAALVILAAIIALVMILTTEVLALGNPPEPQAGCVLPMGTVMAQPTTQRAPDLVPIAATRQMEKADN